MITPLLPRLKEAGDTLEVNKAIIELARQANIPDQANTAQIAINTAAIAQNTAGIAYGDAYHWQHNSIINGNMAIAQRGTSFSDMATATYMLDRYVYGKSLGTGLHSGSQIADVPTFAQAGIKYKYSMRLDCITSEAAIAAAEYCYFRQIIEGQFLTTLVGKTATLSFWVKATKPGIYSVGFSNSAGDKSYVAEYTVNTTDTWEFKTITLTIDNNTVGTAWLDTTGYGMGIFWVLAAGSNYHGAVGSWNNDGKFASANQVNAVDDAANMFFITGLMLNEGSVAAPFRLCGGTPAQEELLCQRYLPCMNGDDINDRLGLVGFCFTTDDCMIEWEFKIVARAAPTSIVATITDFYINTNTGAAVNIDAIALAGPSRFGVGLNVDVAGTPLVAGDGTTLVCLTAGAKMYLNGCEL